MINRELTSSLYDSISDANEKRVFEHWHASSIAECPRAHYFKRKGVEPTNPATAAKMLRWKAGHIIEEVIRPHLEKLYPDLESNVRLTSDKLDLTGEYDNYSPKLKTIFEIKSVHVFAPKHIEKEGKPYLNHEYQNHSYKILLEEKGLEVDKIVYVYIALDGRILTIDTVPSDTITEKVKRRIEVLNESLKTNTPPPCFCSEGHPLWKSTMQYCDYQTDVDCCNINLLKEK